MRIALLDDNDDTREIVSLWLESHYEVHAYAEARALLEDIPKKDFDVLLLDLRMPEISGIDVARTVASAEQKRRPILIAMTAAASPKDEAAAKLAGFDVFIPKPVDFPAMLEMLRQYRRSS